MHEGDIFLERENGEEREREREGGRHTITIMMFAIIHPLIFTYAYICMYEGKKERRI